MQPPRVLAPPFAVCGFVVLLVLGPKGGKSTTAAGVIAEASRRGIKCALITNDEPLRVSLQRLDGFGANLANVYLDDVYDHAAVPEQTAALEIELMVVDNLPKLAELHPDFGANSQGDAVLWGRLVSPFSELARSQDIAVVLIDQARRSDGAWSGSTGKGGNVDLLCELRPKDGGLVCTPRGRINLPTFRVDLDANGVPVFTDTDGETAPAGRLNQVTDRHRREVLAALQSAEPEGLTAMRWQSLVKERVGLGRSAFFEIRRDLYGSGRVTFASRLYRVARNGTRQLAALGAEDDGV